MRSSLVLLFLGVAILVSRSFRWGDFFARNRALTVYLLFALVSVLWSDFPFAAFKKWFRDFGNYAMILVVLSDPHPLEASRTLLRRLGYLLIPLSVALIKYFPALARQYDPWTGLPRTAERDYEQEHVGHHMPGVRNLLFLGYGGQMARSEEQAAETDDPGEHSA